MRSEHEGVLIELLIGYILSQLILTIVLSHMILEEELEAREAKILKLHGW